MCEVALHTMVIEPDGGVRLCCISDMEVGNINTETWKDIFYGKKAEEARERIAKREDKGCIHCASYVGNSGKDLIFSEQDIKLTDLDLRIDNLCNCKCRMCSEYASSRFGKRHVITKEGLEHLYEAVRDNKDYLTHYHLAGGEPMIQSLITDFLQYTVDLGVSQNIRLSYNTNATIVDEKQLDLWKKFAYVHLDVSIDGVGEVDELIREGTKWSTVETNIKYFKNLMDTNREYGLKGIRVHPTVSTLNIESIWKLDRWCTINNLEVCWGNTVDSPSNLSIHSMDKRRLKEVVESNLFKATSDDFKTYMNNILNSIA